MNSLALTTAIDLRSLDPQAMFMRILGVNYVHVKTADEGDLYVTGHGIPFFRHLLPENWYESKWFSQHRQPLRGTGTVYRLPTRPIESGPVKGIDLVVKWSRVGQDVALDTFTLQRNVNAEFNSPFEEFSLVTELRTAHHGSADDRILTQKPLAIYVPAERMQAWQTGRSRDKILAKEAHHPGVLIDVLRTYILIYGWIKGVDAVEAFAGSPCGPAEIQNELQALTQQVDRELASKGFVVSDHKPTHFIVRLRGGFVRRRRDGRMPLALIDYELLSRTPQRELAVQQKRRAEYLVRQRDRFLPRQADEYPPDLKPWRVGGLDYVVGRAQSTSGILWVLGNDPLLFNYFLPERWRGQNVSISETGRTFYTQTKDRLHLVWRISRAGEMPPGNLNEPLTRKLLIGGYNNPFEEFSLAIAMAKTGTKTVYPRAIYMTASAQSVAGRVLDDRAFRRVRHLSGPDAMPILPMNHDYITIWGYWRGLDDEQAVIDDKLWTPIDGSQAAARGLIGDAELATLMANHAQAMRAAGFVDLNLKPDHLLLSHIPGGRFKRDPFDNLEVRHCNFEFVRPLAASSKPRAGAIKLMDLESVDSLHASAIQ